jgi:hypothetical protein
MYSDAMLCFKDAILASKSLAIEQAGESHEEQRTSRFCVSFLVTPLPAKCCGLPSTSVEKIQTGSNVTVINRLMYSRTFEIVTMVKNVDDSKHEEYLVDERLLFSQLAIILFFNMAVTHHFMGVVMLTRDSQSHTTTQAIESAPRDLLRKACGLYNLAYSIPQNEPHLGMIWPGMVSLFGNAILNNLGHCYASLDHTKNSVQCFELLLQSIVLGQQNHICQRLLEEDKTINRCQDDTTMCFWESILFLMLRDPGFAPAA